MYNEHQCQCSQCQKGTMHDWHHEGCCKKDDEMHDMKEVVKWAKKSLLKDKIKERLEAKIGKKMDQIADIAVEMLVAKWEMKQKKMAKKEELMMKMKNLMQQK